MALIEAGGHALPAPTKITTSDEIIWSANAGRSATSGKMIADVIAEKKTVDIEWGVLSESEMATISSYLPSGFLSFKFRDDGASMTITGYRSTIEKEHIGYSGGVYYYRTAKTSIIQQ